jgi:hypothetical protein
VGTFREDLDLHQFYIPTRPSTIVDPLLQGPSTHIDYNFFAVQLGTQRELIARFAHSLALNWNIGEENTQSTEEVCDMARYLHATDPYRHHIVIHTYPNQQEATIDPKRAVALIDPNPFQPRMEMDNEAFEELKKSG